MSKPQHSAALLVGVFLAVVAVVVGAAAVAGQRPDAANAAPTSAAPHHDQPKVGSALPSAASGMTGGLSSQIPDTSLAAQDEALRSRPGVVVARGRDFTIERVALTHPTAVDVRGETRSVRWVYRILVTAGPYQVRDMPTVVSIDGRPLAVGMESADLQSLLAFTFDPSVLTQGGRLQVSFGLAGPTTTTWTGAIEVAK